MVWARQPQPAGGGRGRPLTEKVTGAEGAEFSFLTLVGNFRNNVRENPVTYSPGGVTGCFFLIWSVIRKLRNKDLPPKNVESDPLSPPSVSNCMARTPLGPMSPSFPLCDPLPPGQGFTGGHRSWTPAGTPDLVFMFAVFCFPPCRLARSSFCPFSWLACRVPCPVSLPP